MAKKRTDETGYRCTECGYTQPRWLGRCPECGRWNTLEQTAAETRTVRRRTGGEKPMLLEAVSPQDGVRMTTGLSEFDRVLGGGALKRSAILIGGAPGIGKSTLLAQVSAGCEKKVLYVSGEESAGQIRARTDRLHLNPDNIELLCTNQLEDVLRAAHSTAPVVLIIDSIQTLYSPDAGAVPGTVNQLKLCAQELVDWVKLRDSVLFFSAHITKDGSIAGPKALEHLVDAVISFERNEDDVRFLRALKNRFGSIDELGIFKMDAQGLHAVEDPSVLFMPERDGQLPAGSTRVPVVEGSRVFLVEIQALTVACKGSLPRVFSDKIDHARVSRVAAVLEKHIGLRFSDQDMYVNVAGGMRLREPAIDLALALALYSARTGIAAKNDACFVGELSLAGEIRSVKKLAGRIKTSQGLGVSQIYTPVQKDCTETNTYEVRQLSEAITAIFGNT